VWSVAEYEKQFGNVNTNGLGHKAVAWGNVMGILVPGKRVWKIKRSRVMTAETKTLVDDGSFQLGGPDQLQQMMFDIAEGFLPQRATGVSLDSLYTEAADTPGCLTPSVAVVPASTSTATASCCDSMFSMFKGFGAPATSTAASSSSRPARHVTTPPAKVASKGSRAAGAAAPAGASRIRPAPPTNSPNTARGEAAQSPQDTAAAGRGRPREDLQSRCDKIFQDFKSASPTHERFFGAERKAPFFRLQGFLGKVRQSAEAS